MAQETKNAIRRAFIRLLNERPIDKISIKDIAEMLQISEGAVKQRLSHGRKKFKEAYEERETGKVVARHAKK